MRARNGLFGAWGFRLEHAKVYTLFSSFEHSYDDLPIFGNIIAFLSLKASSKVPSLYSSLCNRPTYYSP